MTFCHAYELSKSILITVSENPTTFKYKAASASEPLITTQDMRFSVIYYLELRNVLIVYCAFHFLPTMVDLVVCSLENINIFTW